jgi:hypothetical protein
MYLRHEEGFRSVTEGTRRADADSPFPNVKPGSHDKTGDPSDQGVLMFRSPRGLSPFTNGSS